MNKKVLLVDDESAILNAFRRMLRKDFEVDTALSAIEGLSSIESAGPYAVVVSDMNMPGIDGLQFLKTVKQKAPDSVRIMLTGVADLELAVTAVNEGNIFRFLTKPCPHELLTSAIQAGMDMYRLITAERELLEKTLSGSIKVLTEMLALVNPTAFGRTMRIKRYVNHIVEQLNIPYAWQFELAAMLSHIGCVTLPQDTLDKVYLGTPLEGNEQRVFDAHPAVARNLLVNIPRLGTVARMIESQNQSFSRRTDNKNFEGEDMVALGGHLIKIAMDFDRLLMQGKSVKKAQAVLLSDPEAYFEEAVAVLSSFEAEQVDMVEQSVSIGELQSTMVLNEDITAKNGMRIAVKGQEITYAMLQRLRAFHASLGINEPFRVLNKL